MKRRSFLAMLGLAPVAAVPTAKASDLAPEGNLAVVINNGLMELDLVRLDYSKIALGSLRSADGRSEINFDAGYITAHFE